MRIFLCMRGLPIPDKNYQIPCWNLPPFVAGTRFGVPKVEPALCKCKHLGGKIGSFSPILLVKNAKTRIFYGQNPFFKQQNFPMIFFPTGSFSPILPIFEVSPIQIWGWLHPFPLEKETSQPSFPSKGRISLWAAWQHVPQHVGPERTWKPWVNTFCFGKWWALFWWGKRQLTQQYPTKFEGKSSNKIAFRYPHGKYSC